MVEGKEAQRQNPKRERWSNARHLGLLLPVFWLRRSNRKTPGVRLSGPHRSLRGLAARRVAQVQMLYEMNSEVLDHATDARFRAVLREVTRGRVGPVFRAEWGGAGLGGGGRRAGGTVKVFFLIIFHAGGWVR